MLHMIEHVFIPPSPWSGPSCGSSRRQGLDGHASLRIEPAHPRLHTPKRCGQRISAGDDSS